MKFIRAKELEISDIIISRGKEYPIDDIENTPGNISCNGKIVVRLTKIRDNGKDFLYYYYDSLVWVKD